MAFLVWENMIFMILRDNKPGIISNPNVWSPVTGGMKTWIDETYSEAMSRELLGEICVIPENLQMLGVSPKGNCFFYGRFTNEEKDRIILKEGRGYAFFLYNELSTLPIGGAFRIYLDLYPEIFRKIAEEGYEPNGSDLNLTLK